MAWSTRVFKRAPWALAFFALSAAAGSMPAPAATGTSATQAQAAGLDRGLDKPGPAFPLPEAATRLARRVFAAADHGGLPFAVVDKAAAVLMVYRADGHLAGATPVLLGLTPGDQATADVGQRTQAGRLRAADRTTPAGRFAAEPGHNLSGESVVWIDYGKAFAIHRLRAGLPQERRAERLASPSPADNRISAGCVVVPVKFYEAVVDPLLGRGRSVFYVMPEERAASASVALLH